MYCLRLNNSDTVRYQKQCYRLQTKSSVNGPLGEDEHMVCKWYYTVIRLINRKINKIIMVGVERGRYRCIYMNP